MIGFNGGLIGGLANARDTSISTSVPGVWTLAEQRKAKLANLWPVVGGDPDFSSVTLLLHLNGTNGSTNFTGADTSPSPKTLTPLSPS